MTTALCGTKSRNWTRVPPCCKAQVQAQAVKKGKEGKKIRGNYDLNCGSSQSLKVPLILHAWHRQSEREREREVLTKKKKLILIDGSLHGHGPFPCLIFYQSEAAGMNDKGRKTKAKSIKVFLTLLFSGHNQNKLQCTARRAEQVAPVARARARAKARARDSQVELWLLIISVHTCLLVPPYLVMFFCYCCTHEVWIPLSDRCRR